MPKMKVKVTESIVLGHSLLADDNVSWGVLGGQNPRQPSPQAAPERRSPVTAPLIDE